LASFNYMELNGKIAISRWTLRTLPSSAPPSMINEELLDVVTCAVARLQLDWPQEKVRTQ